MSLVLDVVSWICLLGGGTFVVAGGIGVVRLPDVYARLHAAGMTDTLGAGLILLGLIFQAGWTMVTIKLVLIGIFLFFTSPTSTYALANAALNWGLKPWTRDDIGQPDDGSAP